MSATRRKCGIVRLDSLMRAAIALRNGESGATVYRSGTIFFDHGNRCVDRRSLSFLQQDTDQLAAHGSLDLLQVLGRLHLEQYLALGHAVSDRLEPACGGPFLDPHSRLGEVHLGCHAGSRLRRIKPVSFTGATSRPPRFSLYRGTEAARAVG